MQTINKYITKYVFGYQIPRKNYYQKIMIQKRYNVCYYDCFIILRVDQQAQLKNKQKHFTIQNLNVLNYLIDQYLSHNMFGTRRVWFDSQRSAKKAKETSPQQLLNGLIQLLSQNIQSNPLSEKGSQLGSIIGENDQKRGLISNRDFCESKERSTKGHQNLLDPRDQELVYPFAFHLDFAGINEEIEGEKEKQPQQVIRESKFYSEFLAEMQAYLSEIVESITSISFNLLNQSRLTDSEVKAFASKNILQNIQQICLETRKSAEDSMEASRIQKIMLVITHDLDAYLLTLFGELASHYPQASGGGQTARMREVILNVNRSADETNDLIFTKKLKIEKYVLKKKEEVKKQSNRNNQQEEQEYSVADNLEQEKQDELKDSDQDFDKQDAIVEEQNNPIQPMQFADQQAIQDQPEAINDGFGETDYIQESPIPLEYLRYSGFIMEVINASINVTRDSYSERQQISIFEKFYEFNEKMFVINEHEPYRLAINKAAKQGEVVSNENSPLQNIFSYFQKILIPQSELTEDQKKDAQELQADKETNTRIKSANPRKIDKHHSDKSQLNFNSEVLEKQLMGKLQDLKKSHKYAISQKIPNSVRPFGENEIKASSFQINNSTILRIMTKWAENLEDIFKRPEFHTIQRLQRFKNIKNETIYLTAETRQDLCKKIKTQSIFVQNELKKLKESNIIFQSFLLSQPSDNINTFLKRFTSIRETCSKMNAMLTEFTHKYLCILIYHLLEAGEGIQDHGYNQQHINLVSFRVGDLLRSKFECSESSFISIVNTLNLLDDAKQLKGKFKLVRVKNKLNQKDNNILVNYLLFNKVQCELQISIQNMKGKEKNYYNYCHFLYELTRGKFGVLTEFAIIVSQHDSVISSSNDKYYRPKRIDYQTYKKAKPKNPQNIVFKKQENLYICLGCKQLKIRQNIGLFSQSNICNDCIIVQQKEKATIALESTDEENNQYKIQQAQIANCIEQRIQIQKLREYLLDGLYKTKKIKRIQTYKQIRTNQYLIFISNYGRNSNQLKLYKSFYHHRELKTFLVELNTAVLSNFDSNEFDYSKLDYFDITQKRRLGEVVPQLLYSVDKQELFKISSAPQIADKITESMTNELQPQQQPMKQEQQQSTQQAQKKIENLCTLLDIDQKLVEKIKFFMKAFKQFRVEKEIVKSLKFKTENIDLSYDQLKLKTLYKINDEIEGKNDEALKYRKFKIKQWRPMNKIQLTGNNIKSTYQLPAIVSKASELNLGRNKFEVFKTNQFQQSIEILSFYWNQREIKPFIDLSKCKKLTYLYAFTSQISVIKLTSLTNLKFLDLSYNNLQNINLSTNVNLEHIDLMKNNIKNIKLIHHNSLMYVNVSQNQCEKISIKYNQNLTPEKCVFGRNNKFCRVVVHVDSIEGKGKAYESATKFVEMLYEERKALQCYTYHLKSKTKVIRISKNLAKRVKAPPNQQIPIQEETSQS